MVYPSAPWNLQGHALLTLHFINAKVARALVPLALDIVAVLPGKTLGGIYLSSYGSGSVLEYHELIVTAALVRYGGKIGSWISHIYVDNEDSVAGGREIWGLPKELAAFTWNKEVISVCQNEVHLCLLNYPRTWLNMPGMWQPRLSGKVFSELGSELMLFESTFQGPIRLGRSLLTVPPTSPFAKLALGQPLLVFDSSNLQLVAGAPQVVGGKGGVKADRVNQAFQGV